MDTWDTQLRKGIVELAVLAVLSREEAYGYRIVERLRARPALDFTESTVYPVLTRLAREGMLAVRNEPLPRDRRDAITGSRVKAASGSNA